MKKKKPIRAQADNEYGDVRVARPDKPSIVAGS